MEGFSVEGGFFLVGFRLKVGQLKMGLRWKGFSTEGEFLVEWVFG